MAFMTANLKIADCCYSCGRDTATDIDHISIICNHTGRRCHPWNRCGEFIRAEWVGKDAVI